jgi:hypothetical protein
MSIAVEFERFILTATIERRQIVDVIASKGKRNFAANLSGGDT